MIKEFANVESNVRNALLSIKIMNDLVHDILSSDADDKHIAAIHSFLLKTNMTGAVNKSIDRLISLAKACDLKIDDNSFDVEKYIIENNICGHQETNS